MYARLAITALLLLNLTACGEDDPVVLGLWSGETSGCMIAADDGAKVTVSISNNPSGDELGVISSPLGKPTDGASSCQSSGATVDGYQDSASFSTTETCDGVAYTYTVDLKLDGADTLKGTLGYGAGERCTLTLMRGK
jgi:hypothetical protein